MFHFTFQKEANESEVKEQLCPWEWMWINGGRDVPGGLNGAWPRVKGCSSPQNPPQKWMDAWIRKSSQMPPFLNCKSKNKEAANTDLRNKRKHNLLKNESLKSIMRLTTKCCDGVLSSPLSAGCAFLHAKYKAKKKKSCDFFILFFTLDRHNKEMFYFLVLFFPWRKSF